MKANLFKLSLFVSQLTFALLIIQSCSKNNADKIKVIEHAFNSQGINNTISLCYNDDINFKVDNDIVKGKKELRGAAEWDSTINTRLSFSDFKVFGDTVICKCIEENDLIKLEGLDKDFYDPVSFVFKNGKISYCAFNRTRESIIADSIASTPFMEWIKKERKEQFTKLLTDSKFVINSVTASGMLALAREWKEAIK